MDVGDYVRFDYHRVSTPIQIAKITVTHYDSEDDSICYSTDIGLVIDESDLVKEPSPNIIDLIEVGDYVNGEQVSRIKQCPEYHLGDGILIFNEHNETIYSNFRTSKYYDIKSIVTKEQFERIKYEVE